MLVVAFGDELAAVPQLVYLAHQRPGAAPAGEEKVLLDAVALLVLLRQRRLDRPHQTEQLPLVDEGQQRYPLVLVALPVGVLTELGRVEVRNRGAAVDHELLQLAGQTVGRPDGHHAHQLLEGSKGGAVVEGDLQPLELQVGAEGRVVIGVVPAPAGAALVVVAQHPAHPLDVLGRHLGGVRPDVVGIREPELLPVVGRLPQVGVVQRQVDGLHGVVDLPVLLEQLRASSLKLRVEVEGHYRGRERLGDFLHCLHGCGPREGLLSRLVGRTLLLQFPLLTARLLPLLELLLRPENLVLHPRHEGDESVQLGKVDLPLVGQVVAQVGQQTLVEQNHLVDRAAGDRDRRQVGQKVVAAEEAHEHQIVDAALEVDDAPAAAPPRREVQLVRQVLAKHRQPQELQRLPVLPQHRPVRLVVAQLGAGGPLLLGLLRRDGVAHVGLRLPRGVDAGDDLPYYVKVHLVRRQPQHDQVRVHPVQHVPRVGVVPRGVPLVAHEVHDLVLALPRRVGVRVDDVDARPRVVQAPPLLDEPHDPLAQLVHEGRAGRDHVAVPARLLRRHVHVPSRKLLRHLVVHLRLQLGLRGGLEAARPLLVHLRARRDAVDGEEEQLARPHEVEEPVQVVEDALEHHLLRGRLLQPLRVAAGVDQPVHVYVEVVGFAVRVGAEQRQPEGLRVPHVHIALVQVVFNVLGDARVPAAEPSVKGRNSHGLRQPHPDLAARARCYGIYAVPPSRRGTAAGTCCGAGILGTPSPAAKCVTAGGAGYTRRRTLCGPAGVRAPRCAAVRDECVSPCDRCVD
ncbi:peptide ABC transporter permease, putative [Babesia caballi]|uniref:Peptide ABC transporter permease, putative n=1 Tax=Babesia caballi TaxID=5871 RepID=A0AAV4LWQ3_BABCB|nr:peptide ABC transporter permease, putative [Babesia caballi]